MDYLPTNAVPVSIGHGERPISLLRPVKECGAALSEVACNKRLTTVDVGTLLSTKGTPSIPFPRQTEGVKGSVERTASTPSARSSFT